jgi:hypothetical protein
MINHHTSQLPLYDDLDKSMESDGVPLLEEPSQSRSNSDNGFRWRCAGEAERSIGNSRTAAG